MTGDPKCAKTLVTHEHMPVPNNPTVYPTQVVESVNSPLVWVGILHQDPIIVQSTVLKVVDPESDRIRVFLLLTNSAKLIWLSLLHLMKAF